MGNNTGEAASLTAITCLEQEEPEPAPGLSARNKGGRPAYRRDDRTAKQVEAMSGFGIPRAHIAGVVGICENTLRKY